MNVCFAIALVFLYFLSFATDIDYVEHTLRHKIISFGIQLCVLAVPTVTAIHLYKSNWMTRKLALIGNYCGVIGTIFYLLAVVYFQPSKLFEIDFVFVFLIYVIFASPFIINLNMLKKKV